MEPLDKIFEQFRADQEARQAELMKAMDAMHANAEAMARSASSAWAEGLTASPAIDEYITPMYDPRLIAGASMIALAPNIVSLASGNNVAQPLVADSISLIAAALADDVLFPSVSEFIEYSIASRLADPFERMREAEEEHRRREAQYHEDARQQKLLRPALAKMGWYIHGNRSWEDLRILGVMVDKGRTEEAEAIMMRIAEEELSDLPERAKKRWPERFNILHSAFKAHEKGDYFLSIPPMLAQADGISTAIFDVSIFGRDKERPRTHKLVNDFNAAVKRNPALAEQLTIDMVYVLGPLEALYCSAYKVEQWNQLREQDPLVGSLNRHAILQWRGYRIWDRGE